MWPVCLLAAALGGCALPSLDGRSHSSALPEADALTTRLGRALAPLAAAHPGHSGIHALPDPYDAFAARVLLARVAERSLDVQYYIWRNDVSGTLLFEALRVAADRGVRVRLLLDDNGTAGLDTWLSLLNLHPNIEVRLFNPFVVRRPKWLGFLTDFSRVNRRMHNKSFTADNQATIIGGRNIGDEYFGAADGVLFADLDVLAVGPVVGAVSGDFDRYWASDAAYPVERLVAPPDASQRTRLAALAADQARSPTAGRYMRDVGDTPFIRDLLQGDLALDWAATRMVSDDPDKVLGEVGDGGLLIHQLGALLAEPRRKVELVSPYFVPTGAGVDALAGLVAQGVEVRVLTNAWRATDVPVVHAGYAKRRQALLQAGVSLYELRGEASAGPAFKVGPLGSSGSSLHAKTFAVDDARVFIGSFNFDPRSARLNTELGFVIESPTLARGVAAAFSDTVPASAYEVRLSPQGTLYWVERRAEDGRTTEIRHDREPGTTPLSRAALWFLSLLPIEWLL